MNYDTINNPLYLRSFPENPVIQTGNQILEESRKISYVSQFSTGYIPFANTAPNQTYNQQSTIKNVHLNFQNSVFQDTDFQTSIRHAGDSILEEPKHFTSGNQFSTNQIPFLNTGLNRMHNHQENTKTVHMPFQSCNFQDTAFQAQVRHIGNQILEESKHYVLQSGVTAVHMADQFLQTGSSVLKQGVQSGWKMTDSIASNTLTQINRYTPDIYDVGHQGQGDLTSEMGSFLLGNGAMLTQNAVRAARFPAAHAINIGQALYYNPQRMEKIKTKAQARMETSPLSNLHYVEIATGQSRKDIFLNRDRYAWNRYRFNDAKGLSSKEKKTLMNNRFWGKRYERVTAHQKAMQHYSSHLKDRQFSIKRSIGKTISNQSRKFGNAVIQGNDSNSMTNRTMWYASKAARGTIHAGEAAWKHRAVIAKSFRSVGTIIRHPIQSAKAFLNLAISMLTSIGAVISTIPVVASILVMLLPVLIIGLCILTIFISMFGWYVNSHGYTFHEIKLCDTGNAIKDIANVSAITNKNSQQYKLLFENAFGEVKYDNWGLAYIEENGVRWYCNALATYYNGAIGDKYRVTLESGVQINTILCDIKADAHTHAGNNDPSPACLSADGSMLEFYGHANSVTIPKLQAHGFGSINNNLDADHKWKGPVVKMEKAIPKGGSISGSPDFSNSAAWRGPNNPYAAAGLYGQCTWFAWGRFYEIYGFSPGFNGNGYQCVSQLLAAHPDKFEFSRTPKPGAVGSSDRAHNHVWIVTGVQGQMITIQEGNLDGVTNSWEAGIKDWRTAVYSLSQLQSIYGNISFANPK